MLTVATLLSAFARKQYFVDDRELALNLCGVRSVNRTSGKYDDTIAALVKKDGEWTLKEWAATVDPSPRYLKRPINRRGTAALVPDQYLNTWEVDNHNGWITTLCQRNGPVRVFRDSNRNVTLDYDTDTIQIGNFGINFHPGLSAGCQCFEKKSDHGEMMKMVSEHVRSGYPDKFHYTLFTHKDILETVDNFSATTEDKRLWANWIIEKEARRDSRGNVMVYRLKQGRDGDGGGTYEVCGINDRYHPEPAKKLRRLIESGRPSEAEEYAKEYIRSYTSGVADWHPDSRVGFFLRDCAFNRGPTGAGTIYQIAIKSAGFKIGRVDGRVGDKTKAAGAKLAAEDLIFRLVNARQTYERRKRSEKSSFWVGLSNRWVDCGQLALGVGDPLRFGK